MSEAFAGSVDDRVSAGGDVLVRVRDGVLRGRRTGGLTILRGVRYATAARFAAPVAEPPWSGVRDALEHGPVSPQPPTRAASALGPSDARQQSDDCLSVTVVSPGADGERRPVLVWLHGGSYRTGAGSWDRYRGDRLAHEGGVVVVNVNSRLGVLGYLRAPGAADGNLGLLDQIEALRWVRANAAYLGGDPDNITVVGQSSGAHSIGCLLGVEQARPLFRRAVMQSPPMRLGLREPAAAERAGQRFLDHLGQDPRQASLAEILAAQQLAERDVAGPRGFSPVFTPVAGVHPLPGTQQWRVACERDAPELELIIGTTRREVAYFLNGGPIARRLPLIGRTVENAVVGLATRSIFDRPVRGFAGLLAQAGAAVHVYRVSEASVAGPYRSGHCTDLPRLWGNADAWRDAPLLAGQGWTDVDRGGATMRAAWLAFATGGARRLSEASWPAYTGRRSAVYDFNL